MDLLTLGHNAVTPSLSTFWRLLLFPLSDEVFLIPLALFETAPTLKAESASLFFSVIAHFPRWARVSVGFTGTVWVLAEVGNGGMDTHVAAKMSCWDEWKVDSWVTVTSTALWTRCRQTCSHSPGEEMEALSVSMTLISRAYKVCSGGALPSYAFCSVWILENHQLSLQIHPQWHEPIRIIIFNLPCLLW